MHKIKCNKENEMFFTNKMGLAFERTSGSSAWIKQKLSDSIELKKLIWNRTQNLIFHSVYSDSLPQLNFDHSEIQII